MTKWEYKIVYVGVHDQKQRPHTVNDEDVDNWEKGLTIYEFLTQLGDQGWELIGVSGESANVYHL